MRDIKFRAWDRLNKRWIDLFLLRFSKDGDILSVDSLSKESYGLHQVELIQFTGLKDKNGKEIYEGDILDKAYLSLGGSYVVEWDDNEYNCGWNTIKDDSDVGEVIGNIYENSELLEEK